MNELRSEHKDSKDMYFKALYVTPHPTVFVVFSSSASKDAAGAPLQSISASQLLKQQKQKQQEFLQRRRQRAVEIQKKVLQSSSGSRPGLSSSSSSRDGLMSPKAASEVPKASRSPDAPHTPTLGRGFSEGEDILFFENSTPPPLQPALSLSAAKLMALKKLQTKGVGLKKEDPNAVKRKRSSSAEINARVEKNRTSPKGAHAHIIWTLFIYFLLIFLPFKVDFVYFLLLTLNLLHFIFLRTKSKFNSKNSLL